MNPYATIQMSNGAQILIELLPTEAKNTVDSFIAAVQWGIYDNWEIERIVPGSWIDMSYSAFHNEKAKYLIPYEKELHPEKEPLPSHCGSVCMGGYGNSGLSGCEFFFPLRPCPEHRGIYPVFGTIRQGKEEIIRLSQVEIEPVAHDFYPDIEINRPIIPQKIASVSLQLNGYRPDKPILRDPQVLPSCWT